MVLVYGYKENDAFQEFQHLARTPDQILKTLRGHKRVPTKWMLDKTRDIVLQHWFDHDLLMLSSRASALLSVYLKDLFNRGQDLLER